MNNMNNETKAKLKEYLPILKRLGVKTVEVAFSGYGDEGNINEVVFIPELNKENWFDHSNFDDVLYEYLDPASVGDWINNEGGFGTISINVETGKIQGEINFNETTYTTAPLNDQL
jgi:hypothetical protein